MSGFRAAGIGPEIASRVNLRDSGGCLCLSCGHVDIKWGVRELFLKHVKLLA